LIYAETAGVTDGEKVWFKLLQFFGTSSDNKRHLLACYTTLQVVISGLVNIAVLLILKYFFNIAGHIAILFMATLRS